MNANNATTTTTPPGQEGQQEITKVGGGFRITTAEERRSIMVGGGGIHILQCSWRLLCSTRRRHDVFVRQPTNDPSRRSSTSSSLPWTVGTTRAHQAKGGLIVVSSPHNASTVTTTTACSGIRRRTIVDTMTSVRWWWRVCRLAPRRARPTTGPSTSRRGVVMLFRVRFLCDYPRRRTRCSRFETADCVEQSSETSLSREIPVKAITTPQRADIPRNCSGTDWRVIRDCMHAARHTKVV